MVERKMSDASQEELFVDKFIGRESFLMTVDKAINDAPNKYVIPFIGKGGMGKTALLRTIHRRYEGREDIIQVTFDLTQSGRATVSSFAEDATKQLLKAGIFTSDDVQQLQNIFHSTQVALIEGGTEEEVSKLEKRAVEHFIEYVTEIQAKAKLRAILFWDTLEEIEENVLIEGVELAASMVNAVHIWAGRPTQKVYDCYNVLFPDVYGSLGWEVFEPLQLDTFDITDVAGYFAMVLPMSLPSELVETITILTEGKPILLALTAEWFKHNVKLPEEVRKSRAELEAMSPSHLEHLRVYFERALVERVRAVRKPLDRAILYMSYLDRRYDRKILQLVLNASSEEVEKLESQLRRMAFVRSFLEESSGLLHDEAKRLINLHAWPPYDHNGEERRILARKVIDGFYLPKIEALHKAIASAITETPGMQPLAPALYSSDEYLVHRLEMECLDYHYRISLDEGRRYVTELIEEGLSLPKREGIRYEITRRAGAAEATVAAARMNLMRGRYEESRKVLEDTLQQKDLPDWYRMTLLYELSDVPATPQEKTAYLEQAMGIAEQMEDRSAIAEIYNSLGLMYRRQGLWKEAETAYQNTLDVLKTVDDPDQKASTLNNLAYVKLLQGEFDFAGSLADIALEMREAQGDQLGVAFSYLTKGEIAQVEDNLSQALYAYRMAASIFEKLGRDQNHAQALVQIAEVRRHERDLKVVESLLAMGLAQPPSEVRAQAECELGALRRTQGMLAEDSQDRREKLEAAIAAYRQSLRINMQRRDLYGQARTLVGLVFVDSLVTHRINEEYSDELEAILRVHNYPILRARLDEVYADVVYERGETIPAFHRYIDVAKIFSTHHIRRYNTMFERLRQKFLVQSEDVQKELFDYFAQVIKGLPEQDRLRSSLVNLRRAVEVAF